MWARCGSSRRGQVRQRRRAGGQRRRRRRFGGGRLSRRAGRGKRRTLHRGDRRLRRSAAPPRARWLLTGWSRPAPAAPPQQTWWHSPARSRVAPRAWAEARCPGRTGRAMRWAATDPASAPQPPDAARWCGQRSARWRCWRAPRGPAARASAARWRDWDTADPPRVAAAAPPRSCRPAGHATSSPGSSMKETTRTPPATKPPAAAQAAVTQARGAGHAPAACLNPPSRDLRLPATSAAQHRRIRFRPCRGVACGGADGKDAYGRRDQDRNHRVQAARPGRTRSFDGRHSRALAAHRERMAEAPGGRGACAGPAEHRQCLPGDDRSADRQPRPAGRRRSWASGRTT